MQDAFSRAFVRWRRISKYDDPVAWIRHVALNRLRDHYRREGRKSRAIERLAAEPIPPVAEPGPPSELAETLATLSTQQRIAVSLFYVEQLSVRETAAAMKLSEGAVKFHLHAARIALRPTMDQDR